MKKIPKIINRIIGIVFLCMVLAVIVLSLSKPQHNLIPGQTTVLVVAAACFFAGLYAFLKFLGKKFELLYSDKLFVILALIWGALLIATGVFCRNSSVSFYDYEICYRSAYEYAVSGTVSDGMYFSMYPHNWKCVMVLSLIMKTGMGLGFKDPYYFLLIVNVVLLEGMLFSCKYFLNVFTGKKNPGALMLLILFGSCLPVYAYAQTFYTDGASMPFAVMGMAVFHKAFSGKASKTVKACLFVFAGVLICMGETMKITGIICVIAAVIVYVFSGKLSDSFKKVLPGVLLASVGFCLFYFAMEAVSLKCSWYRDKELYADPMSAWVAMGLGADGTYYENREFRIALDEITYSADKNAFAKEYIRENISGLWDADHIMAKIRANYASGNLGAGDFARYSYGEDNLLNRMFNYDGDLYWYACKYNMIFMFQIYLVMAVGAFYGVRHRKEIVYGVRPRKVVELTFIGYFVFLFFWEANNRQLFNMLPVLITGYVMMLGTIRDAKRTVLSGEPGKDNG